MKIARLFLNSIGYRFSRRLLSSAYTYRLARLVFAHRKDYPFEANRMMVNLGLQQTARAYRRRQPVAWTSAFFPEEIIHALGLVPFAPEVAAATAAALGLAPELLNRAERLGFSRDTCSFHRCAGAGTLEGFFPAPDLLVASSHLCDGAPQLFRYLSKKCGVPFLLLDVPSLQGDRAERYVQEQLKQLAGEIEKITGRRLTAEAMRRVTECSNRSRAAQLEVSRLRRAVPSPMRTREAMGYVYLQFLGHGLQETAAIYERLAGELTQKLQGKRKYETGKARERFRLIWLQLGPYYPNRLFSYLEDHLHMPGVFEEMNFVYWPPLDPEQFFLTLARKVLSHPSLGPAGRRLELVLKLVKDYRAQAVVHFSHWGCRQAVGGIFYLKEELRRRGVPFLSLDGDCVDASCFPPGQALTRLQSLQEILEGI
ncbi:MAG TPA: 2-hydroxyacyl-CoA dehydratase [Firmicutes bacterium]|nr:2-hydroxyacyl-CoA dehydratase [Bacillota bacterium]